MEAGGVWCVFGWKECVRVGWREWRGDGVMIRRFVGVKIGHKGMGCGGAEREVVVVVVRSMV